ncbi:MAG: hypothetical protein HN833_01675 [Elusimicrobiaceae bacterium]|jgi:hypothetical protein|nr:hypothetical protein [Elusimicrobiaceae bacterium]MBT3954595.1 hypothetical protein [Elusimicrobiaceae bacterium]MBT4007903.1 hypothetical protein [Elusimicrobiaceae bacterium]MBT4403124.1 hypothetical protein [Elusimicrobiaceae bacterium]MBT4439917.1 hypothetical protein [Elusimicrobiaceae bacterium]
MKKFGNFILKIIVSVVFLFAIYISWQMFYDAFILKYGSEMRFYTLAFMIIILGGSGLLTYTVFNKDK